MRKLPLRKCLQCHEMKREDFLDRCPACYEMNDQYCQYQVERGEKFPLDYNLIGWVYLTARPGLHDYLWYFLKWCIGRKQPEMDRRFLKKERGRYMYPLWAEPVMRPPQSVTSDVIVGAPIGRYIPATDTWELAPYVKDEFEDGRWPVPLITESMIYYSDN